MFCFQTQIIREESSRSVLEALFRKVQAARGEYTRLMIID